MGSIPIVFNETGLAALYADLPVYVYNATSDVTEEALLRYQPPTAVLGAGALWLRRHIELLQSYRDRSSALSMTRAHYESHRRSMQEIRTTAL